MTQAIAQPDIQLIANVVVHNERGEVLLTRYDDDVDRWWLPGGDLQPYEHPDQACTRILAKLGLAPSAPTRLHHVESFRGRRGWHVMFNEHVATDVDAPADCAWFPATALPRTAHGEWERSVIAKVLASPDA